MSRFLRRLLTESFPGKREGPAVDVQAAAPEPEAASDQYESRAFAIWWELLSDQPLRRVMDLGTLRPGTLAFFGANGVDLGVAGLDPAAPQGALDRFDGQPSFNGALCWDLPNYLEEPELVRLGEWLAEHLAPGAPVFLTLATRTPYADHPATHEVVSVRELRSLPSSGGATRTVVHSAPRLGRQWPEFVVNRSFLLRNGMQEYVLTRRAPE